MPAKNLLSNGLLVTAIVSGSILAGSPGRPAMAAPIPVFVSVLPQKFFVERLAGPLAEVSVMVGPGQSPATHEPSPRQMSRLSKARIYFSIGVPFERAWIPRIRSVNPRMAVVDTAAGVKLRAGDAHRHPGDSGQDHDEKDPHVWTSPRNAVKIAEVMAESLGDADPENGKLYRDNYRSLAAELEDLDIEIRRIFSSVKNRSFMVFHPSWGYFADTYDLTQIPIETGGREPGARYLVELIAEAERSGVKAIFVQPQFSIRNAETVARAVGAKIVTADPLSDDYIVNLLSVARAFAEAMQ